MVIARVPIRKAGYYSRYGLGASRADRNFMIEKRLLRAKVKVYSEIGILVSITLAILLTILI